MKTSLPRALAPLVACGGCLFGLVVFGCLAADWPQWRGPHRDGVSAETGLMKEWPPEGPKLIWQSGEAGSGYSTPAVQGDRLFLLGNDGLEDESARALSVKDGRTLWKTRLGKVGNPDQQPKFPAARSTPTVDGEWVFALGSDGDLAALAAADGAVRWQRSLRKDFGGKPGVWAYAESPLIDGEVLVCTPGGVEATVVALNKKNGEVLWKAAVPGGEEAAYASAVLAEVDGVRQYVQMLQKGLVGLEAKTGKVLWRYDKTVSRFNANIPTPLVDGALVYSAGAGTGGGAVRLKSAGAAFEAEPVYFSPKLPSAIGGVVKVGEHLFGTSAQSMLCADFATGTIRWEERVPSAAALCVADGRLILHGENGEVSLVEPSSEGYREKGRFSPPGRPARSQQMEKSWAYPVVAGGRLYLRDHGQLWCYDVRRTP